MVVINASVESVNKYFVNSFGFSTSFESNNGKLFVVRDAPLTNEGNIFFTTNEKYNIDSNGFLVNSDDMFLQAWPLDINGNLPGESNNLNTISSQLIDSLNSINISDLGLLAFPTNKISIALNLKAYELVDNGSKQADFEHTIRIYDSLKAGHDIRFEFVKTALNIWEATAFVVNASESILNNDSGEIVSGLIEFNGNGTLKNISGALFETFNIKWSNGANSSIIDVDFGNNGNQSNVQGVQNIDLITQFTEDYNIVSSDQNGIGETELESVIFKSDAYVSTSFDNGEQQDIFKIPLAQFPNPDGLKVISDGLFQQSVESGAYDLIEPSSPIINNSIEFKGSATGTGAIDLINGSEYGDILKAGQGDDQIFAKEGSDTIHGGKDNDFIQGNSGGDIIYGEKGNDLLRGGKGDDTLYGGEGNDTLYGDRAGNIAFSGNILNGGSGNDVFVFSKIYENNALVADKIEDFESGVDKIQISSAFFSNASEAVLAFSYDERTGSGSIDLQNAHYIILTDVTSVSESDFEII